MADTPLPSAAIAPDDDATARRRARRGTLITLGILLGLVSLVVLLTPVSDTATDTRLTTLQYGAGNARLASDLARRLGWQVRTTGLPLTAPLDTSVIYAVFGGPTAMQPVERDALLDAVRRGAGLLVAPSSAAPFRLLTILGLRQGPAGLVAATPLGTCAVETDAFSTLRVRPRMLTFVTTPDSSDDDLPDTPYPTGAITLLSSDVHNVRRASDTVEDGDVDAAQDSAGTPVRRPAFPLDTSRVPQFEPTVVAFPLGEGRVVALADPDILRTDQMRNCAQGSALTVVRGLEYLSRGRQRSIVFAEYYQGLRTDGPSVVLAEWLTGSGAGRMVLTLMAAGVLLLLARGRRTLAPVYHARDERRSALEHVDALATAWHAVRGTRTVARMLARGIRRRHAAGRWRTLDDTAFLAALAERHPSIADEAARLTRAIDSPAAPSDLPALRAAAAHIDAECLTP